MEIKHITKQAVTRFLLNDPVLCNIGLSDTELQLIKEKKKYNLGPTAIPLGLFNEDKLIAYIRCELITEHSINVHIFLSSSMHHKGVLRQLRETFENWLLKETGIMKCVFMAPESCAQVINACKGMGFNLEGRLTKCIEWRGKLVDLLLFGYCLERE